MIVALGCRQRRFGNTAIRVGLRLSEAAHLKLPDIDSDRTMRNVALGKGHKQRQAPLSSRLLEALGELWSRYRPTDFLFPGKTANKPYAEE